MFPLALLFGFYFVQFSTAFLGAGGLFSYVFKYQKLCFCRCGVAQFPDSYGNTRLFAGQPVLPHQFPWLAAIQVDNRTITGTLISDRHVITAASPLYGLSTSRMLVTLGSYDGCSTRDPALSSSTDSVILHPAYLPGYNDIALLRLRHVVPFSQFIAPVCLPHFHEPETDQVSWIVSWKGKSNSVCTPEIFTLPTLPLWTCLTNKNNDFITSDKGCLGPIGIKSILCEGDIGAPVMSRRSYGSPFRLVGVVSSANCGSSSPPLYTKVAYHAAWIYDQIRDDCQCFSI